MIQGSFQQPRIAALSFRVLFPGCGLQLHVACGGVGARTRRGVGVVPGIVAGVEWAVGCPDGEDQVQQYMHTRDPSVLRTQRSGPRDSGTRG
jgi:hypothetical protein